VASAVRARAYNGGLVAEQPLGSRGSVPGQGVRGVFRFWTSISGRICCIDRFSDIERISLCDVAN